MAASSSALIGLTLVGSVVLGVPVSADETLNIEIFTTSMRPVANAGGAALDSANVTTYTIDGLARFEAMLSEGLGADPEVAKAEAVRRLEQVNESRMAPAKNAAMGLAKAIEYSVDRYPAIVFDGSAVVYGVTDLIEARERYQAWQRTQTR